jgi:GH15 family glucan-1,4-alpha-glucosidase
MAWVAIDRAVKSAEQCKLDGPIDRWRALRDEIHADVCANGFNSRLNAFVQAYGSDLVDASLLLMPLVGFLPATDARVRSTIESIEKHLLVDGLVLRYDSDATDDGLPAGEGAFLACSFWLADNYILLGRHDDARRMFERLLSLRNDVGLLAEGYDPRLKRQVGNFPQGYSHIALLSTAFNLSQDRQGAGKRPASQRIDGAVPAVRSPG